MKAIEQYYPLVHLMMPYKLTLTFEAVDAVLKLLSSTFLLCVFVFSTFCISRRFFFLPLLVMKG